MKDTLVFLFETHLKPVLGYFRKIDYCKIDLGNIYIKLYKIFIEVKVILKQKFIELVRLSDIKYIENIGFSSS